MYKRISFFADFDLSLFDVTEENGPVQSKAIGIAIEAFHLDTEQELLDGANTHPFVIMPFLCMARSAMLMRALREEVGVERYDEILASTMPDDDGFDWYMGVGKGAFEVLEEDFVEDEDGMVGPVQ